MKHELKYKITWEHNYKKILQELEKEFEKPKPNFVGFFSLTPKHEYDLTTHCNNLNHINYICDVEKVEWLFCPTCKIKTIIAYNSRFTMFDKCFEKTMGIDWNEYCNINQKILEKCENLSDTPFQTRDEILDHISDFLR